MTFKWTPGNVQKLKKMLAEGMSARQIAEEIGEISRNSVIGKAHRLGLSVQIEKKAKKSSSIKKGKSVKKSTKGKPEAIQITRASPNSESTCQWPIGDPGTPEFKFCYEPAKPGRPYCQEHCDVAYRKLK